MSAPPAKEYEVIYRLIDGGFTRRKERGTPAQLADIISGIEIDGLTVPTLEGFHHIPPHAIIRYEVTEVKP